MARKMDEVVARSFRVFRNRRKSFQGNNVLRKVIRELGREEAQITLLELMQKNYVLPEEYVERTIAYLKKHDPRNAAYYAFLYRENEDEYCRLFDMESESDRQAKAEKQKRKEKRLFAIKREYTTLTEEEQEKKRSGYDIEKLSIDDAIELIDIYERGNYKNDAVKLARSIGLAEEAVKIYERNEWFHSAAKVAEEDGLLERALEDYEFADNYVEAGQVALRIAEKKREARVKKGLLGLLQSEYNEEEKKYLRRAVQHFVKKDGWKDTAKELADKAYSVKEAASVYVKCRDIDEAIEYALTKKAYNVALEICENHGDYHEALIIATLAGRKEKAATYKKIIALREYGHNKNALERAIEEANARTDKETVCYMYKSLGEDLPAIDADVKKKNSERKGIERINKYLCDIRDVCIAEGAYEAIKWTLGVHTTGQLIKRSIGLTVSAMTLIGSCTGIVSYETSYEQENPVQSAQVHTVGTNSGYIGINMTRKAHDYFSVENKYKTQMDEQKQKKPNIPTTYTKGVW